MMALQCSSTYESQVGDRSNVHDQTVSVPSSSNVDTPPASHTAAQSLIDLQAARPHQQTFLPSPPASDISSRTTCAEENDALGNGHRIPSYRFVSIAQALSEHPDRFRDLTPLSISRASTAQRDQTIRDLGSSSYAALNFSSNPVCDWRQEVTTPTKTEPLLDLVWRDFGNGISRAYSYRDLPPILLSRLPEDLTNIAKADGDVVDMDANNIVPKHRIDFNSRQTTPYEDLWLLHGDLIYCPSRTISKPRTFPYTLAFTSNEGIDCTSTTPKKVPGYRFIELPESPTTALSTSDSNDERPLHWPRSDIIPTQQVINNIDAQPSSSVQSTQLSPHSVSAEGTLTTTPSIENERYTPNTSSGFSDTDDEKPVHTQSTADKLKSRRRRRRQKKNPVRPSFTQVAVLHAAEGLMRRRSYNEQRARETLGVSV